MTSHRNAVTVAAALLCAVAGHAPAYGAFTLNDIGFWAGPAPGPDISQAVLVIDFVHPEAPAEAPSLAWGYRWPAAEQRTGQDMLLAILGADPRLTATGLESGFVDTLGYDADLDGVDDYRHPGFDPVSGRYSVYWVNNDVIPGTPPFYSDATHVMPPNGNPYASDAPGSWVGSTTGLLGRPLADGSWDGWVYDADPAAPPREPIAAIVPEPGIAPLLALAALLCCCRRQRPASRDRAGAGRTTMV